MKKSRREILKSIGMAAIATPAFSFTTKPETSMPLAGDVKYWDKIREQFMLSKNTVFFNTGTIGAMPRVVVEKMTEHLKYIATSVTDWAYLDDNKEEFISGYNNLMSIRTKAGKLINANASEIAMTDNVTHGMSYIANGITLQPGDEVITSNQEHGGGQSGFILKAKRYGSTFKTITIGKPIKNQQEVLDAVIQSFTPQTKVLMLSHMISGTGAILPVKEICAEARKRGIFTILDGAQTVGHIKIDMQDIDCDAYAGCFHKWFGAPAGTGFLYIKPDKIKDVWNTVASYRWDDHKDEGFRFTQRGTGSFPSLKGLDAALDFHNEIGPDKVFARIKELGLRLRTGLRAIKKVKIFSPEDEAMCAGITLYNIQGMTGAQLQEEYWKQGRMRPRSQGPEFGVRHSTNIFNSEKEIDRAIEIVKGLAG